MASAFLAALASSGAAAIPAAAIAPLAGTLATTAAGVGAAALPSTMAAVGSGVAGGTAAGAGAFSLPSLVQAASGLSSVMGSVQQRNAGIEQGYALEAAQKQEGIRARDEGIVRRERLLNTLASQNARVGASGVNGASSNNVGLTDIDSFRMEQDTADLSTKLNQKNMLAQAKSARKGGKMGGLVSLINSGVDMEKIR